jgi:hypothetical protein
MTVASGEQVASQIPARAGAVCGQCKGTHTTGARNPVAFQIPAGIEQRDRFAGPPGILQHSGHAPVITPKNKHHIPENHVSPFQLVQCRAVVNPNIP